VGHRNEIYVDTQLKRLLIGMVMLMLSTSSCNLGAPSVPTSDNSAALTLQALVETVTAQAATTAVDAPATLLTQNLPTATELPPVTAAPIVFTPTFTVVPTPTIPMVSVTKGTNCRSGPGVVYNILGGAPVGIKFVLIGKSTPTNYWIIQLQDGRQCWLWGQYAVVEGNVAALPEYVIPPTPLPPLGSITGTIRDIDRNALSGIMVVAQLSNQSVMSRADGTYSFDNLRLGSEYLTIESSDFAPAHLSVNVVLGITTGVDFQLRIKTIPHGEPFLVQGRVLMNSSPASGVTVWVWSRSQPVTTDSNGSYSISILSNDGLDGILVLAQLGNMRGATELLGSTPDPVIMPDIILLSR